MPRGVYDRTSKDTGWCRVAGCDRPSGHLRANICEMHYCRKRRTGSYEPPLRLCLKYYRGCPNCGRPFRLRKSSLHVRHCSRDCATEAGTWRAENNATWQGDQIGYSAAHVRIREQRGAPSACEGCGELARHWALDHDRCTEPRQAPEGPYSPDPYDYVSLCVSCHKIMDLKRHSQATRREQMGATQ